MPYYAQTGINIQSVLSAARDKSHYGIIILLLPAKEVCEGYVFTGVCLSTGGTCIACMHALPGTHAPGYACPPSGYYEMRSMSGQYASYWNAFLFLFFF